MKTLNHEGHEGHEVHEKNAADFLRVLRVLRSCAVILALATNHAWAQQKVDVSKSRIRFVTKQMNVPVEGAFKKFDANVSFDPAKPEATKAEFEVDLGSIDLGTDEGNTEVKRKAWLNIDAFPKAKFAATSVKPLGTGKFEARGPLTIKGATQPIVATFTVTDAAGTRTVDGGFPMKRLQYKIGEGPWADTDTVADEVLVRFHFVIPNK
jgi:polyisoprenoid-binding protein YceI